MPGDIEDVRQKGTGGCCSGASSWTVLSEGKLCPTVYLPWGGILCCSQLGEASGGETQPAGEPCFWWDEGVQRWSAGVTAYTAGLSPEQKGLGLLNLDFGRSEDMVSRLLCVKFC